MFRVLPPFGGDPRAVAEIINGIMNGKTNNTGSVTLATGGATSTVLYDERISPESKIILLPASSAAYEDTAPFGEFSNTNGQVAPSAGSSVSVQWDTTNIANNVYISDNTRINVRNAGVYSVTASLQLSNTSFTEQFADVWLKKNGNDVMGTGRRFYLPRRTIAYVAHVVGVKMNFIDLDADDYIEITGAVSDISVTLEHFAADPSIPRPSIPACTVKVEHISPQSYSNIFVSSQGFGQATIEHWANSTADKTYAYVVIG